MRTARFRAPVRMVIAADAGLVVPINLGPDAVIVGTLSGH